jgi:pyruvate, water dikinase
MLMKAQHIRVALLIGLVCISMARAQVNLSPIQGTYHISTRLEFDEYAARTNFPGAMQIPELKFLMTGVNGPTPVLHLQNTQTYAYHYYFATGALKLNVDLETFNSLTYFSDGRRNLAGSIVAHDHYVSDEGHTGIYTLEFWPSDPVPFSLVSLAHDRIMSALPFIQDRLYYHPSGEIQRRRYEQQAPLYDTSPMPTLHTETLFANRHYAALNPGETYGRLRIADGIAVTSFRDIVIYRTLPNTLGHVAGILTAVPQTPLSHVNLLARQNHTPNAYVRDITTDPQILAYEGMTIHLVVEPNGFRIEPASAAEVEAYWAALRPSQKQYPRRDLSVTQILPLHEINSTWSQSVGVKSANMAELLHLLPAEHVPDGFVVPFWFYHRYMQANGFYALAATMLADPLFKTDPIRQQEALAAFRKTLKRGTLPQEMVPAFEALHRSFPEGTRLRCRSSTNNEDLPGFNGAGLYSSYTHHLDEGPLSKSIKQVWASLWNYRAFVERDFYRIDHLTTAMGVLVHPNFENEQVNGVAVNQNIYDRNWSGYTINAQLGEDLVTNPQADSIPEEILVLEYPSIESYELTYVRLSNQIPSDQRLLTREQVFQLTDWMDLIQSRFNGRHRRAFGQSIQAMEIEFKVTADGILVVKQARPWVE